MVLLNLLLLDGTLELAPYVKSQMIPRLKMTSLTPFLLHFPTCSSPGEELDKSQHFPHSVFVYLVDSVSFSLKIRLILVSLQTAQN